MGDGVLNSFNVRTNDAIAQWNAALSETNLGLRTRLQRVGSSAYANVVLSYPDFDPGNQILGRTTLAEHTPSLCPVHGTSDDHLTSATIEIDYRGDWFTQGWDRRALWESCPSNNYQPPYTCAKTVDYGSTITHELGHIFSLAHPIDVDCHINCVEWPNPNGLQVSDFAKCKHLPLVNGLDQATMCQIQYSYRSEMRTRHAWDVESLRRLYNCHLFGNC